MRCFLPLLLAGCGTMGSTNQSETCAQWIDCVTAVTPAAVGDAVASYGENGTCWSTQGDGNTCTNACEAALAEAFVAHDAEPACDTGIGQTASAVLQQGQRWNFTSGDGKPCETDNWYFQLKSTDAELVVAEGARFRIEFEEAYFKDMTDWRDIDFETLALRCDIDYPRFECQQTKVIEGAKQQWDFTYSGAFSQGSRVARGTLYVRTSDHEGELCAFEHELTGVAL